MEKKRRILLIVLLLVLAAAVTAALLFWHRDRQAEVTVTTGAAAQAAAQADNSGGEQPDAEKEAQTPPAPEAARQPGQSLDLTENRTPEDDALHWGLSPANLAGGCVMAALGKDAYYIRGDMLWRRSGGEDELLFDAKMVCCSDRLVYTLGSDVNDIFVYDPATGENRALGLLSDTVIRVELDGEPLYLYEQNVRAMITAGHTLFLLTASWDGQAQDLRFTLAGYDLADNCRRVYLRTEGNPSSMTYAGDALYVGLKDEKKLLRVDARTFRDKQLTIPVPAAMAGADEAGYVYFTDDSRKKAGAVYFYNTDTGVYNLYCTNDSYSGELYGNILVLPDNSGLLLRLQGEAEGVYLFGADGRKVALPQFEGISSFTGCGIFGNYLVFPESQNAIQLLPDSMEEDLPASPQPAAPTPGQSV